MKNITISLDDKTYRRARVIAAQRATSVSALVRMFLRDLGSEGSKTERLKREERALREQVVTFRARDRLSRDAVHDRSAGEAEPSFDDLAAEFRRLTRGRRHTPAEVLIREGRDER